MAISNPPAVDIALIGGSGTLGCHFPEDADMPGVDVVERDLVFDTPYGETTKFKLVRIAGSHTADGKERLFLTNRMHGWRKGEPRSRGSEQLFWVLKHAGVRWIISNAGVGSVNPLLDTRDFIVPTDFIDLTTQRRTLMFPGHLIIMRQPICPSLHTLLIDSAAQDSWPRIIRRGVLAVTEGPRFETRTEVANLRRMGADLVAQSMVPEVSFAREIGACYAAAYVVSNYGEGVVRDWEHRELKAIYEDLAVKMSRTLLRATAMIAPSDCGCDGLRKKSILQWDEEEIGRQ